MLERKSMVCLFALLFLIFSRAFAGWFPDRFNTDLSGYVSELPLVTFEKIDDLSFSNIINARGNFRYFPTPSLNFELAVRLQLLTGDLIALGQPENPIIELLEEDRGYFDLSRAWSAILFGNIDRAFVSYSQRSFHLRVGRQRINWGTNLVWNPNDWFNAFDYLDFDYDERPGSDAVRIQYFTGVLSVVEAVVGAAASSEEWTYALMYRFNRWGYDLQFQGGLFGNDAAAGLSYSGDIRGGGFRGEISSYYPVLGDEDNNDNGITVVASISGDYTFPNGLYLLSEVLYNGFGEDEFIDTIPLLTHDITAKDLTPARYLLYGSVSYPFSPIIRGSLSVMLNPSDLSFLTMPSVDWSLSDNLDLLAIAQLYSGDGGELFGMLPNLVSLRLRWFF
ncbi:hypothetical protein CHISP_0506 [Chitinispirillum alkaliphilum]|nr:hypothetical protein CHISP_0506 [Chitinispirillum alkaliphilum]